MQNLLIFEWFNVIIYIIFLSCSFAENLDKSPKDPASQLILNGGVITKESNVTSFKKDDGNLKKSDKDSSTGRTVPRKGVNFDSESDQSHDKTKATNEALENSVTHKPIPGIISKDKAHEVLQPVLKVKGDNNNSSSVKASSNSSNVSSTAKPVMKPAYTADDYSSADYDSTGSLISSKSNWFLTTISLTVLLVSIIVIIYISFCKIKYKFSLQKNYRRVDYLIDGMYID